MYDELKFLHCFGTRKKSYAWSGINTTDLLTAGHFEEEESPCLTAK